MSKRYSPRLQTSDVTYNIMVSMAIISLFNCSLESANVIAETFVEESMTALIMLDVPKAFYVIDHPILVFRIFNWVHRNRPNLDEVVHHLKVYVFQDLF